MSDGVDDPLVVLVIGASSGIGRSTALRYAEQRAHVVLASRSADGLEVTADACRRLGAASVLVVPTDVTDSEAVGALIERTTAVHGSLDIVVFSAGVMAYGTVEAVPEAIFTRTVDVAIHGTANVARSVLPVFRDQDHGVLVVVTSLLASVPVPQMGAYITGKWGQLGLVRILQLELRARPRIDVCAVAPGAVDTPIYRRAANYTGFVGRPPPPVQSPDQITDAIVEAAGNPRRNRSVGHANHVVVAGFRLLPRLYDAMVTPLFRRFAQSSEAAPTTAGNVLDPDVVVSHADDQKVISEA